MKFSDSHFIIIFIGVTQVFKFARGICKEKLYLVSGFFINICLYRILTKQDDPSIVARFRSETSITEGIRRAAIRRGA